MNNVIKLYYILIIFCTLACEKPERDHSNEDVGTDDQTQMSINNSCPRIVEGCYCDRKIYKEGYYCCFSNEGGMQFYYCTSSGGEENDGYWAVIQDERIVCPGLGYPICPDSPYNR